MKTLKFITGRNIMELTKRVNTYNQDDTNKGNYIQKEDIVSIVNNEGQFFLLYFK